MDLIPAAVPAPAPARAALVWSPHPLLAAEGRIVAFDPPTGAESLHDYLTRMGVDLSGPVIVSVDRAIIPRDWLHRVKPKPGTFIAVRAAVAGGGDGSQVVAVVAMIALTVAAPYLAGAAYGLATSGTALTMAQAGVWAAGTTMGVVMTGAVTMLGSLAISALMPKPKMDLGRAMGGTKESPTYSLTGGSNQARPYEPLGLTLGTHRVFFDLASRPYTTLDGDDQYLNQVFCIGMHGPHGPLRVSDLRLGTTPLTDYQDVETEFAVDTMPTLVASNVDTQAGAQITQAGGDFLRTTSPDTTRIEVDIQANLFYAGNGGIEPWTIYLQAEYRPVGGGAWQPFIIEQLRGYYTHYWSHGMWVSGEWIQDLYDTNRDPAAHSDGVDGWRWRPMAERAVSDGAPADQQLTLSPSVQLTHGSTTPLRRTLSINVPAGQYEVRVRRTVADATDSRETSDTYVTAVKSYQQQPGSYAGQCFLAVKVRASGQLNGTLSQLSGIVQQPVDVRQYSSNPARLFRLFAQGYRVDGRLLWGAGLDQSELDLDALYAWESWCQAKGLVFNAHIDSSKTVWDVLQAIARCGRASPSWATGKLGVLWDAEAQPVITLFGPSNIKRGSFAVAYDSAAPADEITLTYINAADNYTADTVRIAASGVVSPVKPASIELWGCTSRDQAVREVRLALAHQLYRTRLISWVTDMEGLVVTRGDVVALSHDLTQWGTSGRLVGGTTTQLQLDRAITLDAVANWITVVSPTGQQTTCRVQYQAGEVSEVTLLDPLPSAPDADSPCDWRWLADYQATPGKRVKIVEIKPTSMNEVSITAMDDPDEYYPAESGAYDPPPVRKWTADAITVGPLAFAEELVRSGAGFAVVLTVTWPESGAIATRRVRYRLDSGPWVDAGTTDTAAVRLTVPDSGVVDVEVTAYNGAGQPADAGAAAASHIIVGQYVEPPAPTGFSVARLDDGTRAFSWAVNALPPDVAYIEIRYAASAGTAWGSMAKVGLSPYRAGRAESNIPVAGTWTFEARLLDVAGNYSATGVRVTATLGNDPSASLAAAIAAAEAALADGAIETYFQPAPPDVASSNIGDLWFDTDDSNKLYRRGTVGWEVASDTRIGSAVSAAATAQATADSRIRTYVAEAAPGAGMVVGDLWYRASTRELRRWSGLSWDAVATLGADGSNLNVGLGVNLLPNTEFGGGSMAPVVLGWNPSSCTLSLQGDDTWRPASAQALVLFQGARTNNAYNVGADAYLTGGYADRLKAIPVIPGKRYEISGKLAAHRADSMLALDFFDINGTHLGGGSSGWVERRSGGRDLASWTHAAAFAIAPAGAVYASLYWRKSDTDAGQSDSFAWLAQPYFGEATAAQTVPSAYSPGVGRGALSNVDKLTPGNASAYVDPSAINTTQLNSTAATEKWLFFDAVGYSVANYG